MYDGGLRNLIAKNKLIFRSSEFIYKSMTILLFTLKRWDLFYLVLTEAESKILLSWKERKIKINYLVKNINIIQKV